MNKPFTCPLWEKSLSLESGLRRRLCCHDETGASEEYTSDPDKFTILKQVLEESSLRKVPSSCIGCYQSEINTGHSPRLYYQDFFSKYDSEKLLRYVDITFENICNLSCFTCKPLYSNKVEREFDQLNIPFKRTGLNVKEFKKKFENIKNRVLIDIGPNSLIVLSGGEPSLSPNVKSFIDDLSLLDHASTITLRVFSNLTICPSWILKYVNKFKKIEFIISIDAIESRAEYIRHPSNWKKIDSNYKKITSKTSNLTNFEVSVHSVLSVLNFDHIPDLINYFLTTGNIKIVPSFTLITSPKIYKVENLPKEKFLKIKDNNLEFLRKLNVTDKESKRIDNLASLIDSIRPSREHLLLELVIHHKKIDSKRNTSLLEEISYLN